MSAKQSAAITAEVAYPLDEAAALKRVSPDHLRRAIRTGALRAKKVGRGYRIGASALESWWDALDDA